MLKLLFTLILLAAAAVGGGAVALLVLGDDDDSAGTTGGATPRTPIATGATGAGDSADAVLQEASAAASAVTSFHFRLTHENGSTPLPMNLGLEAAEGDVVVPDALSAEVEAEAVGINVDVRVIGIEGRTWITNPFTRNWEELSNTNIRDFADPAALVSGLLPAIENAELNEGEEIDGVQTDLVTGTIQREALRDALGLAEPGGTVEVEAWIGVDDRLPRRVRLIGSLTDDEDSNVVRQVDISRYDQPVEIMPPE